jgi:hypothetical protein
MITSLILLSGDVTRRHTKGAGMTSTTNWQDATVLLPIPLKHAVQVAEFAAGLTEGRPSQPSVQTAVEGSVTVPEQGPWTQEMVQRLAIDLTYEGVVWLLDYCAQRPGQWTAKAEIETAGGFSAIQLRNELGAFSKKTRNLFGKVMWPMEWKKERGTYSYRLDPVIARWWAAARKESDR